jgi:predicted nuclease of predicted toxin-antitoxin system
VVLTFDLDFGHILAASHERATSVVIYRVSNARPERVNAHLEGVLRDTAVALALDEGAGCCEPAGRRVLIRRTVTRP